MNSTTAAPKRTMKNPASFVGKRIDPNKWNIPAGYALCRKTTKLHRHEDLEVTFAHWKFEDAFLHEHGIYVEDAEWLSEEGYDEIMAKLEELGLKEYYVEYPALPFPGSQPETEEANMHTEAPVTGIPAELEDSYDSTAEFESEVRRLWSLDECLEYPCAITLTHALELLRDLARNGGYDALLPGYEKFIAACKDDALLMDADRLLQDYQPRAERDSTHYGLVRR